MLATEVSEADTASSRVLIAEALTDILPTSETRLVWFAETAAAALAAALAMLATEVNEAESVTTAPDTVSSLVLIAEALSEILPTSEARLT